MSTHEAFQFHSKWDAELRQHRQYVGITCCECGVQAWKTASNPGLANRIFHNEGWLIGTRRSTDVCPDCRAKKKHRPMTPTQKVKAYREIEKRRINQQDNGVVVKARPPVNEVMKVRMTEALKEKRRASSQQTVKFAHQKRRELLAEAMRTGAPVIYRGREYGAFVRETGWKTTVDACDAARIKLSHMGLSREGISEKTKGAGRAGVHFTTRRQPDGTYTYYLLVDVVDGKGVPKADLSHVPPIKQAGGRKPGVKKMKTEVKVQTNGHANGNGTLKDFDGVALTPVVTARVPTVAENRKIHDALTENYDEDAVRYRRSMSDRKLAEALDVPAVWVRETRERFFGPYDRNEYDERRASELDDALQLAKQAMEELLLMASRAEEIKADLAKAKAKLEAK